MKKPNLEPLIYDRTASDVALARDFKKKLASGGSVLTAEERAIWDAGLKGAFNVTDLNRMEDWIEFLGQQLRSYGYDVYLSEKKIWSADGAAIYKEDIDRIRDNTIALRDSFQALPEWRQISYADTMTLEQLNAMEWDLNLCYVWLRGMVSIFPRSGQAMVICGSVFFFSSDSVPPVVPPKPPTYDEKLDTVYAGESQAGEDVFI